MASIRAYPPDAAVGAACCPMGRRARASGSGRRGLRGDDPGRAAAARLRAGGALPGRRHVPAARPVLVPADARRARHPPRRRGAGTRSCTSGSARTRAQLNGVERRRVRGLGAERRLGQRGRRLQRLGRPAEPDALARRVRDLGARSSRAWTRARGTSSSSGRARGAAAEGRPARVPHRKAAGERLGRLRAALRWGDDAWLARRRASGAAERARSRSTRCTSARGA